MNIKAKVYCDGLINDTDNIDIIGFLKVELKAKKLIEKYEQDSTLSDQEKKDKKKKIKDSLNTKKNKVINREAINASITVSNTDVHNILVNYCSLENNGLDYILGFFTKQHIVPDVWRYTIKVSDGGIQSLPIAKYEELKSDFSDRPAIDAIGTKIILLILESPHTSEYEDNPTNSNDLKPKAPAQGKSPGDAGGAIERYLHIVLRQTNLANGFYSLVISNPVQYQCSLDCIVKRLNGNIRDAVWQAIWKINCNTNYVIQEDFVARYATYQPVCTINCCTASLTKYVSELLINRNIDNYYKTTHPSVTWNSQQHNLEVHKI